MVDNRRVVHEQYGAGEIREHTFIGLSPVTIVKFDSQDDDIFVLEHELRPETSEKGKDNTKCCFSTFIDEETMTCSPDGEFDFHGWPIKECPKLPTCDIIKEKNKEISELRTAGLKEAKEIEDMNDATLVEAFENIMRNGAGPGVRRVVFIKREMLKRMRMDKVEKGKD